ncbi:DUF998 domain-containing protein [Demequina activiva]|uniref:DUF998 domain-containing protein n=1 Tax=Demequina activiva TaxID=1582364 RepID=A0A919Q2R4_9MICO|nr:DUF998 domain-containing protein [Demequina activiva]GIG54964.1 hypothetical protein Dac01nite_17160 [Demequina activiva]
MTPPAEQGAGPARVPLRERENTTLELTATGLAALAFVVVAAVALPVFRLEAAPISGPGSVGQYAAVAAAVAAALAFAAGRYALHTRSRPRMGGVLDVVDVAALALAHGIIALLGWTLAAAIMAEAFIGATVFALPVLAVSGAAAAVSAYIAFLSAVNMGPQLLAVVLATFLVGGVLASALTASDPEWWMQNLSTLGISDDLSARAFNITLVIAGFLVTVLARVATRELPTATAGGQRRVLGALVLVGVFLGCVGIFNVDTRFWIHTAVASGMVVAFGVLTIRLRAWVPGISRAFLPVGWAFLAIIVVLAAFFAAGYYSLTAVELVAGVLVFTWIILFQRNVGALDADTARGGAA